MLEGLGLAGYRSFGHEVQFIGPFSKINVLVGQNNAGKSNVLRFLVEHLDGAAEAASSGRSKTVAGVDQPLGATSATLRLAVGLQPGGSLEGRLLGLVAKAHLEDILTRALRSRAFCRDTPLAWLDLLPVPTGRDAVSTEWISPYQQEATLDTGEWQRIWHALTNQGGGGIAQWISQSLAQLRNVVVQSLPPVSFVPAIREVTAQDETADDFSGRGIVMRLAKLQNPGFGERELREQFDKVNAFLRTVLGTDDAHLEIPHERNEILTHVNGKTLPLNALGTGVHEVVILAAAATSVQQQIVCIEEPEIHLHPVLQRKLLDYLARSTDNQYFIATHSAHLLDAPESSVWHVRLVDGWTAVRLAQSPAERSTITVDLGYRASDLLQSNAVIWVEGPSDRIYIQRWLAVVAPQFVEGVHFSVMFYGGRLLSQLSADDSQVTDFVSLRRINRWMVVVMDSDRSKKGQRLNATKLRIQSEFADGENGHVWVTAGREIENYLPSETLAEAVKEVHPEATVSRGRSRYSKCLALKSSRGRAMTPDKVKIARAVAQHEPDLERLDLRKQVERLALFIELANENST